MSVGTARRRNHLHAMDMRHRSRAPHIHVHVASPDVRSVPVWWIKRIHLVYAVFWNAGRLRTAPRGANPLPPAIPPPEDHHQRRRPPPFPFAVFVFTIFSLSLSLSPCVLKFPCLVQPHDTNKPSVFVCVMLCLMKLRSLPLALETRSRLALVLRLDNPRGLHMETYQAPSLQPSSLLADWFLLYTLR